MSNDPLERHTLEEWARIDPTLAEAVRQYRSKQLSGGGEGITPANARSWTVHQLLTAEFPDPVWIIPDIVPAGLSILGGRPKVGKSWFLLQIAHSVGMGGKLFNLQIVIGKVLYLALEDNPKRLQERLKASRVPEEARIVFHTEWRPLNDGGLGDLLIELEGDDYKLVILDTLSRAVPGVDQNDPTTIGPLMAQLQNMAINRNIGILVCDHIRKPMGFAGDPIDDIISSTAKTAIADTILALYKEQGKPGAVLMGRGRDIPEVNLKLQFDQSTSCWQSEGDAREISLTERRQEILDALSGLGKSHLTEIASVVGQPKSNTYKRLQDLVNAGFVTRHEIDGKVAYERT